MVLIGEMILAYFHFFIAYIYAETTLKKYFCQNIDDGMSGMVKNLWKALWKKELFVGLPYIQKVPLLRCHFEKYKESSA